MGTKDILSLFCVVGLLVTALLSPAQAGEIPPPGSKPLAAILASVEGRKSGVIAKAEFDDGLWEVKVCEDGICQKVYIDPKSGEVKRQRKTETDEMPPAGAMPVSTIIQSVEAYELGTITEVEFDTGLWEVELRQDGRKTELLIDPWTGDARQ